LSRWRPRACGLVLLVLLTLIPRIAAAQRVLLAQPPAADPTLYEAFGRLRAELELQAFEVEVLGALAAPMSAADLERAAQERGAFAAIALQRDAGGTTAEILIVDRVTGKSTTRRLVIDPSPNGPTLLAVRAADLLRASLVEFAPGERPPPDVVGVEAAPAPPEVLRYAERTLHLRVRAGAVALLAPELGAGVGPLLGASVLAGRRLAVGLELGGPLLGARHRTSNGVATVRQERALLRASYNLGARTAGRRWEWGPRLGVGVYHLEATSIVEPPLVSERDAAWSAAAAGGLAVEHFFARTVSVGLDAGALALLPRPVIAVAEQRSSPLALEIEVSLGLGVTF